MNIERLQNQIAAQEKESRMSNAATAEQIEIVELIACRPDHEFGMEFAQRLAALDVSSSELARRALKHGLSKACREIAQEKTEAAKAVLNRLNPKGQRRPFDSGWSSSRSSLKKHPVIIKLSMDR